MKLRLSLSFNIEYCNLGAVQQAVKTLLTYFDFIELIWQTCWQLVAYVNIQQTQSNMSLYPEPVFLASWPMEVK